MSGGRFSTSPRPLTIIQPCRYGVWTVQSASE